MWLQGALRRWTTAIYHGITARDSFDVRRKGPAVISLRESGDCPHSEQALVLSRTSIHVLSDLREILLVARGLDASVVSLPLLIFLGLFRFWGDSISFRGAILLLLRRS